jgi:hypothetical protein
MTIKEKYKKRWKEMYFIAILSGIIFCNNSYSQGYYTKCPEPFQKDFSMQAVIFALDYTPKQPYATKQLYNTWTKGVVRFVDGKKASGVMLAYNAWLDELLWMNENTYQIGVILKETIEEFVFWDENGMVSERFRNVEIPEMRDQSFFQVLTDGYYTIYCQRKFTYVTLQKDFEKTNRYYLQTEGSWQNFKPTRRSIKLLFPKEQRAEIRHLIRKNYRQRMDETRIIDFFNSLNENRERI